MLIKLIFQLGKLLARNEQNTQSESFTVVFDRSVQNIVVKDKAIKERLQFEANEEENNQAGNFLWDKYFPKPLFYLIKTKSLNKSGEFNELETFSSIIQKFACDKESNLNILKIDDDSYTANIFNLEKFKLINEYYDHAIFGRKRHIESIANSLVYMRRIETIMPLFNEFINYLCGYIKEIRILRDLIEQQSLLKKDFETVLESESYIIEITNKVLKSLAAIKIPSRCKTEDLLSKSYFTEKFSKMDVTLGNSLKELGNDFHIKKMVYMADHNEYDRVCKAAIDPLSKIKNKYKYDQCLIVNNNIVEKIMSLEDFVKSITRKDNKNMQIALDCNTKKLDKFNEKYFLLLMEYCDLMEEVDEFYLTDYHFEPTQINETVEKKLENFYADKLMARELKNCLQNYPHDKTDLKIFTETNYFKKVLSVRIIRNLLDLSGSEKHKNKIFKQLREYEYNEKKKISRIESLYQEWINILVNSYENDTLTFEDLLNEKKFKNCFFKRTTRFSIRFCKKYYKIICIVSLVCLLLGLKYFKHRNN